MFRNSGSERFAGGKARFRPDEAVVVRAAALDIHLSSTAARISARFCATSVNASELKKLTFKQQRHKFGAQKIGLNV